jgi:uncharacterized membrane protein
MNPSWHLYVMATVYFLAGLNHFRNPRLYLKIIPPYFKNPVMLNTLSGMAEIVVAIALCIPALRVYGAYGIMLLLLAVFPSNLYMYQNKEAHLGLPRWLLFIRLPIQLLLLIWAFQYT